MPEYPKPQVPYAGFSDLHFATERRLRSWFALGDYQDRGELTTAPGRLEFRGMHFQVDCPDVSAVRLVGRRFPVGTMLIAAVFAGSLVYLNSPSSFTWRQPLVLIGSGILSIIFAKLWSERWVEVVYSENGRERRAYFRRIPIFVGAANARTRRLARELQETVLPDGPAPPSDPQATPEGRRPETTR